MIIPPAPMTVGEAARILMRLCAGGFHHTQIDNAADVYRNAYRDAVMRHHPDKGGIASEWHELQKAADVLKRHHGIS